MQNKRKILAVALFAAFGLAACNEVVAKPANYDDAIVLDKDGKPLDVTNNEMAQVYDAYRNGALAGDVLDEFLYRYAVTAFGPYNKVTKLDTDSGKTLKEVARLIKANTGADGKINADALKGGDADAFIKAHKAYWTLNDKGERIQYGADNKATVVANDASADQLEYTRVMTKWETIEDRIAKTLYSAVSGGSYVTRNLFEEKEYLYSLYGNMKNVANPKTATSYTGLLWPEVEDEDVFKTQVKDVDGANSTILHRNNYQEHFELSDEAEGKTNTITYVEDDVIPNIYRTLLTEQYLYDETYQLLGRSYARKVNVIKLSGSSVYTKGASYLMDAFIKNTIFNTTGAATELADFKVLSNAYNGAFMAETNYATSAEYKLWEKAGLNDDIKDYLVTAKDGSKFIAGTSYGDMMEKYDKISNNPAISQNESDFTGNGTYVKEVGKQIQTRGIQVMDNTTTGWYIKNGGLTDLPETIRSRLFNIAVPNALNKAKSAKDATYERRHADGTYDATKDDNNYVAYINGKSYLKNDKSANGEDPMNDILFVDGDNYYIVQIEEAASTSALSKTEAASYLNLENYGPNKMEEIVNEVCKIVADSESYRTLAKKYFLEKANLKYHDTVIYEYFKSNFPELF